MYQRLSAAFQPAPRGVIILRAGLLKPPPDGGNTQLWAKKNETLNH